MVRIGSLFLKIFLWFWATVIVTGISLVLTFVLHPADVSRQWHSSTEDMARYFGAGAVEAVESHGAAGAEAYVAQVERRTHKQACLFNADGKAIAGTHCAMFAGMVPRVERQGMPRYYKMGHDLHVAVLSPGNRGNYVYVTEVPVGPPGGVGGEALVLRWLVALLVSGIICYLLTRYLTAPILRLREASQQLAAGDLSIRAAERMERRRDELGSLVEDFNRMADRIEGLVGRQRQLIADISHELRSPLARLNVAVDLGRERKGDDPAFDQMERDIERMNEMIGRLLTVARLDTSTALVEMDRIDLGELVSRIVREAEFESRGHDAGVQLAVRGLCLVKGNEELLHSAIENVVRNAVRYGGPGEPVEVLLECMDTTAPMKVRLAVRDYGQGVPEAELGNIFRPFYRVSSDRDRESGGTGLGLAIADRVVRIHGGRIGARNAEPRGLEVEMVFPGA